MVKVSSRMMQKNVRMNNTFMMMVMMMMMRIIVKNVDTNVDYGVRS